jgi:hypothetical protein
MLALLAVVLTHTPAGTENLEPPQGMPGQSQWESMWTRRHQAPS